MAILNSQAYLFYLENAPVLGDCYSPISIAESFSDATSLRVACRMLLDAPAQPMRMGVATYAFVFLLTCVLEAPAYLWFTRKTLSLLRGTELVILVNLATHPLVTWFFPFVFAQLHGRNQSMILSAEIFAPSVEILLLRFVYHQTWKTSILAGVTANLISWWAGLYVTHFLGLS